MKRIIEEELKKALQEKKLNRLAYSEIIKWLTEKEFEEFVSPLEKKIKNDEWDNLMDSFYRTVIFGTGGIRGVMDLGTNRINNYTIRWASQACASYLLKYKKSIAENGVAIAYDSRNNSNQFMKETARVLAANNIPVFIFKYYRATPELSFTVRALNCVAGIVITASHNPPEFNGYKVYDEKGVQLLPDVGLKIEDEFKKIKQIKKMSFNEALKKEIVKYIDDKVDKDFAQSAKKASTFLGRDVKIVYSPLHGVGSQSVLPVLKELGFKDIVMVKNQMTLDGNFSNVKGHFPNPEFPVVYEEAIKLAKKVKANIILVSDPDADRLGIAIPDKLGEWMSLNGNQGAVLMEYFLL